MKFNKYYKSLLQYWLHNTNSVLNMLYFVACITWEEYPQEGLPKANIILIG
jgi:hypothetical protein